MTAQRSASAFTSPSTLSTTATELSSIDLSSADLAPLTLTGAHDHVLSNALRAATSSKVGYELEGHLVDLTMPNARVSWGRLQATLGKLIPLPGGSRVTIEPGGQLELSTLPLADSASAIDTLRLDEIALRSHLRSASLGLAYIGTDPARRAERVNPGDRYVAMESYFDATGNTAAGTAMMCSTASLQVNLEAGPEHAWSQRVRLAHALGPVLVAISASSPLLGGNFSGWRSNRQRVWGELDQTRCGPLLAGDNPAEEWAAYALCAPVMLVRDHRTGAAEPMKEFVPFSSWVAGEARLGHRAPTRADLDYHLTTLFPPVRPRGFIEIRYLDAVPTSWWPALAAITVALLDDPVAADRASAATERVAGQWTIAARDGLSDPLVAAAARSCIEAAVNAVPPSMKADVERYAELVDAGRTPGDEILERARKVGPLGVLRECADA